MRILFKSLLIFIGGVLIGFGMGVVATNFLVRQETIYWIAIVSSLILGGFFVALGLVARAPLKIKKEKQIMESQDIDRQENPVIHPHRDNFDTK